MKEFNYFAPGSVEEALELMKEYEGKYTILNGGTDVMIRLRERLINPEAVIDIKRIPGLKEITFSKKDGLYIGACVTCKEISESEIVKENYPFYAQAASVLGSQLVRGRATSVGQCHQRFSSGGYRHSSRCLRRQAGRSRSRGSA